MKRLTHYFLAAWTLLASVAHPAQTFNATTSKLQHDTASLITGDTLSICFWSYAASAGESSAGRIFSFDELDGVNSGVGINHAAAADTLQLFARWSGSLAVWQITASDNAWNAVAWSYNKSATTNDPVARVNFANATVTEGTAPLTTKPTIASGYCVGNRSAADRTWDGRLAYVQVFDVILTAGEMDQALRKPGSIRRGLKLYLPMTGAADVADYSGSALNGTATDLTNGNGPPTGTPAGGN